MMRPRRSIRLATAAWLLTFAPSVLPHPVQHPPGGRPAAVVDLTTTEGASLVRAVWRYHDVAITPIVAKGPGPDLKPSGAPIASYDYEPKAGGRDFDDTAWPVVDPTRLTDRRSGGHVAFAWYRVRITIPERIGSFDPRGTTVALEIVVDDAAEIWVDGALPAVLGQSGGAVASGFNAPNRVVIGRDVRPGQQIQLAIFGINGPISKSPENFVWVKSATLDFHPAAAPVNVGGVERVAPALDAIVPEQPIIERLATGFSFLEGPVWVRDGGYLLVSDPNDNVIYRWTPDGELSIYRTKSGYTGPDIARYHQPGSNGLTLDREGRLTINEHGRRRVVRLERNGVVTVLADRFEGKRLNSPNDLVYKSDGALYFTDPPFGLPGTFDDPAKELPFSGVFRVGVDGALSLLTTDLTGPNGIAFSPDERILYVSNWDTARKVIMRYDVVDDGTLANGRVFFDMQSAQGEEALDGLKVDGRGTVFASGPGGVWILSPEGKHLGTIHAPELPANLAWGDDDGRTLYLAARTSLYRLRLLVPGLRP